MEEKGMQKVTSDTVAYCSTFRLFVVIIVLSWPNYAQKIRLVVYIKTMQLVFLFTYI